MEITHEQHEKICLQSVWMKTDFFYYYFLMKYSDGQIALDKQALLCGKTSLYTFRENKFCRVS